MAVCDASLAPEAVRAWGARLLEDGRTIDVCVGREPACRLVATLGERKVMALSVANVTTYQALQIKGTCLEIGVADEADRARRNGRRPRLRTVYNVSAWPGAVA